MQHDRTIVVTMTSWRKRIGNVETVVMTILEGSVVPDKIVCNLSSDEFPLREKELPEGLTALQRGGTFEINWVGENTKTFKKLLPTLERYPKALVITIDDDVLYSRRFVERMVGSFNDSDRSAPVTSRLRLTGGIYFACGAGSLYTRDMFGRLDWLDKTIIETGEDDWFYTYALLLNRRLLRPAKGVNVKFFDFFDSHNAMKGSGYDSRHTRSILDAKVEAMTGMTTRELIHDVKTTDYNYTAIDFAIETTRAFATRIWSRMVWFFKRLRHTKKRCYGDD